MRGRRVNKLHMLAEGRNTPAYAGKTDYWEDAEEELKKHPRVCGEDGVIPGA